MAASVQRLIVARHNEPMNWLDQRPAGWKPMVVQTGEHLENGGREPAAFFYALQQLPATGSYAFVQADALRHCPNLWAILQSPVTGFRWLGDTNYTTDSNGAPHHSGLPVGERYEQWLGRPFQGIKWFGQGGQFLIPGSFLTRHTKEKYAQMQAAMYRDQDAWVQERLWEEFWK